MSSLATYYHSEGKKKIQTTLGIKNGMAVPKLMKIAINCGLGEALTNKKVVEEMQKQLMLITGQKPVVTIARRDISTFKLRRGDKVGVKVTLRGKKMYDFCDKLVRMVLPRIRDFRGVSDGGLDPQGNYTVGLSEQVIFLELDYNQVDKIRGMEITFVTTAKNPHEARQLLEVLGMPFVKKNVQ